jgi:hypothetical protein
MGQNYKPENYWTLFFEGSLSDQRYHKLTTELPELLQNVDLKTRCNMWFQQNGAAPHFHICSCKGLPR